LKKVVQNWELLPIIKEKLDSGSEISIQVVGSSMRPFFIDRVTEVTLKQTPTLRKGDICLFLLPNQKMVLHRLIQIKEDHLVMRGDALVSKEFITPSQVLGKVIMYSHHGKTIHTNSRSFRFWSNVWNLLFPFKRVLLGISRRVAKR
jgi:hypothetical protein